MLYAICDHPERLHSQRAGTLEQARLTLLGHPAGPNQSRVAITLGVIFEHFASVPQRDPVAAVRLTPAVTAARGQGQQVRAALKHVAEPGAPARLAFRSRRGADQEWGGEGT